MMIEFHTPPLPAPHNLDLARLDGGGSCPTQFYGETHDGCEIYVRYRGGQLTDYVASERGMDVCRDQDCILRSDTCPSLDGTHSRSSTFAKILVSLSTRQCRPNPIKKPRRI